MRAFQKATIAVLFLTLLIFVPSEAQKRKKKGKTEPATNSYSEDIYGGMEWRLVGPFRGGRSAAVTGVPGKTNLFYMGSTGGGVWRTKDGGQIWENISDGYFGGSIGAVAVSEYDNNVIYVGGGEKTVRGNVSYGYGMWKTVDAGKTWTSIGLDNSRHISRIRIHPKNPDIVYAAVMGDLFRSSDERGVYKSTDGGKSWKRVLFSNSDAGAVDLVMDPNNPRILFASTWRIRRTPYSLESGGEGSGLWKSTDGGETWMNISENKGLPEGTLGIIGVTVSPVNSNRVWALVEAQDGGVFRSDDGGETWRKTNGDRSLRQRAWYYTRIYADTQDEDMVYVMNVRYHRSKDGGKTFTAAAAPHGDHHDLWIAPEDNQRMIIGDDGGAQVSFDAGENWSTYYNQPTSQFYRVTTDNHFPYRIYGAQQDNSTVRISHRTNGGSIGESDWESTAGGESAHLAVKPDDNDIVVGGSYGGYLTWVNHRTNQRRAINVWPDDPMGHGAEGFKYRFQWNFPVFFSPHDPNKLYAASNHLHVSNDMGESWEIISPDLTRNEPSKLGPSGGPITKDNTGVEYYCTVFAATESHLEKDLLWAASDDGLVHISTDAGSNWQNVTPPDAPEWLMWNSVEIDPFVKGGAYLAGTLYKEGNYQPYLYKTKDYGKTWTKIVNGIPNDHFTRVVRADPDRKGLLYAGTESGMYISFDDGASWKPFQLNLPIVPITDLTLKNKNLIAATQGRSFWIIDDLSPLHQLDQSVTNANYKLFTPLDSYRMSGSGRSKPKTAGQNHPGGVMVHFYLKDEPDSATSMSLSFLDAKGNEIKTYSTDATENSEKLDVSKGLNRFVWNMRYPEAKDFDGMILWWASLAGPQAVPGVYKVKLTAGDYSEEHEFKILKDPRSEASLDDMQKQFDFLMQISEKMTETHEGIIKLRDARSQISALKGRLTDEQDEIKEKADEILDQMKAIEETLYQTKNRSGQDPLNFPIRLNNKLGHLTSLSSVGYHGPTEQAEEFRREVTAAIDEQLNKLYAIFDKSIPELNDLVKSGNVDAILLKTEE